MTTLKLDQIKPNPFNRQTLPDSTSDEGVWPLAESIYEKGLKDRPKVALDEADGLHLTLNGHRRIRAYELLHEKYPDDERWEGIPVVVEAMPADPEQYILDCLASERHTTLIEQSLVYAAWYERLKAAKKDRPHDLVGPTKPVGRMTTLELKKLAAKKAFLSLAPTAADQLVRIAKSKNEGLKKLVNEGGSIEDAHTQLLEASGKPKKTKPKAAPKAPPAAETPPVEPEPVVASPEPEPEPPVTPPKDELDALLADPDDDDEDPDLDDAPDEEDDDAPEADLDLAPLPEVSGLAEARQLIEKKTGKTRFEARVEAVEAPETTVLASSKPSETPEEPSEDDELDLDSVLSDADDIDGLVIDPAKLEATPPEPEIEPPTAETLAEMAASYRETLFFVSKTNPDAWRTAREHLQTLLSVIPGESTPIRHAKRLVEAGSPDAEALTTVLEKAPTEALIEALKLAFLEKDAQATWDTLVVPLVKLARDNYPITIKKTKK